MYPKGKKFKSCKRNKGKAEGQRKITKLWEDSEEGRLEREVGKKLNRNKTRQKLETMFTLMKTIQEEKRKHQVNKKQKKNGERNSSLIICLGLQFCGSV